MNHGEGVKFRFDKLTISPYDLVLGEGLFVDEQLFLFDKNGSRLSICSSYKSFLTVKVRRCNVEVIKLVGN